MKMINFFLFQMEPLPRGSTHLQLIEIHNFTAYIFHLLEEEKKTEQLGDEKSGIH